MNRDGRALRLLVRRLGLQVLETCMALQERVAAGIAGNEQSNIFQLLTEEELAWSLAHDIVLGYWRGDELVGQLDVALSPVPHTDLLPDVRDLVDPDIERTAVIDTTFVAPECRGFGLQRHMIQTACELAREGGASAIMATVSPANTASARNFERAGFEKIATRPKYTSERAYYLKLL